MPFDPEGHIVIVGPMGSGKTTLGRLLATELGRPFLDSDQWIVDHRGRTGRDIAVYEGVPVLHDLEAEALDSALASKIPAVVAAAASVVDRPRCRRLLSSSFCVYLTAGAEILDRRSARGGHRRDIGESEGLERRVPLFEEVADMVVDTGSRGEQAALVEVLANVAGAGGEA